MSPLNKGSVHGNQCSVDSLPQGFINHLVHIISSNGWYWCSNSNRDTQSLSLIYLISLQLLVVMMLRLPAVYSACMYIRMCKYVHICQLNSRRDYKRFIHTMDFEKWIKMGTKSWFPFCEIIHNDLFRNLYSQNAWTGFALGVFSTCPWIDMLSGWKPCRLFCFHNDKCA